MEIQSQNYAIQNPQIGLPGGDTFQTSETTPSVFKLLEGRPSVALWWVIGVLIVIVAVAWWRRRRGR